MADEISEIVDSYHATILWEMAAAAGLEVSRGAKKLSKAEMAAHMRAEYFAEKRVLASFSRLDERERAVLNRLLLHGEAVATRSFRREVVRAGLATLDPPGKARDAQGPDVPYAEGYVGRPDRVHSTAFVDVIARLTYRGLVFARDSVPPTPGIAYKLQFHPAATLYVPDVIRRYLPAPVPVPVQVRDWQPVNALAGEPTMLLRDLYLYWDFVRFNSVPLIQSGLVAKRALKAINGTLLSPDPLLAEAGREDEATGLYLLRRMLVKLGLVRLEAGDLRSSGDALAIPPFWGWPLLRQVQACLEAWLTLGHPGKWHAQADRYVLRYDHARLVVLDTLYALPLDEWYEPGEFLEELQDRDQDFLLAGRSQVDRQRGTWHAGDSVHDYIEKSALLRAFQDLEARFVRDCLLGFLHRLGVVDLGHAGEQWQAVRLSSLGRAALGHEKAALALPVAGEGTGKLVVQPNFQVMALGPVCFDWLARLDLFARRERADRGAFEYRISRESIYRAQQLGLGVSEVVGFLETAGGGALPQNVRRSLDEWAAHHERIVFRTGIGLLHAAEARLLDELVADVQTGQHLARAVAPEMAMLKEGRHEPLAAVLLARGLLPAISGARPETSDHSVLLDDEGTIQLIHPVPSLYLQGRLARVAEQGAHGQWRLTPASVLKAGGSRDRVVRLLDELGRLQRGSPSPALVERIKAWGGYYGQAAAATLTLVEFRDLEALAELGKQPALQGLLTPFPAGNRALATVPSDRLEEVKKLLAALGVRVRDELRS